MEEQSTYQLPIKPQFPEQEQLKCPRCGSDNTKFCYYNNYNLSQPRHFCKSCRRYWTKGGALRNIPVGGGSRKNTKRSSSNINPKRPTPSVSTSSLSPPLSSSFDIRGSFSFLLDSDAPYGNLLFEGLAPTGPPEHPPATHSAAPELQKGNGIGIERLFGDQQGNNSINNGGTSSCWNGDTEWPELAMYTPGSSFGSK